ncbi:MAG: fibronectin/fibrinogen-binding protein [Candidatus Thorarchaeota archaeon]|nr:fibronectin/fibrinogen-binding protein [Candidatus Thorarchaeota archaeon]
MKDSMSNIDIKMVLPEIVAAAQGAFIKNVYQYGDVFVLKLYQPAGATSQLLIQPGRRVHLTVFKRAAPRLPAKFVTVLRKYLRDKRIRSVWQHDMDRILVLDVGDERESYKLVAEIFGQGNLLLLDPQDTIFMAKQYRRMKDREVVPKAKYEFPPVRGADIFNMDMEAFSQVVKDSTANVVRTLASRLNLDSLSCEEICTLAGVKSTEKTTDLGADGIARLRRGLELFSEKLRAGVVGPRIVREVKEDDTGSSDESDNQTESSPLAFLPFEFEFYRDYPADEFDSFSRAIDEFFGVSLSELEDEEAHGALDAERARLQKIIDKQNESIQSLKAKAEENRLKGEAIYAHFQTVQEIIGTITKARSSGLSWDQILERVEQGRREGIAGALAIERISPATAEIVVSLDGVAVALDIRKTPQENAAVAFETAKRSEAKVEGALKQIEKTQLELDELVKVAETPTAAPLHVKIRKKKWYEKYRWFFSSEGYLVLGGRDAKNNEYLAKRQMGANDVFLHAALHGAPYVVIKVPETPPGEQTIWEAAQFAVTFSRAWQDGLATGDAYWVTPEQVSFTPPSGEYLPSGAVMIYGTKNYVRSVPIELAVGVMLDGEDAVPVSGPPSAIEAYTEHWLRVAPGTVKRGQLAKDVAAGLRKMAPKEVGDKIDLIPQEDFMRVLPSGDGRVMMD